jgi:hypothetical protein
MSDEQSFQEVPGPDSQVKSEFGADLPRVHRYTLVEMNASVFTARRDAAHEALVSLLKQELIPTDRDKRKYYYDYCVFLAEKAVESTERSQVERDTQVLHYLYLLRDTISAALALVRHELKFVEESQELSRLSKKEQSKQVEESGMAALYATEAFRVDDAVFSESENNILKCVEDLVQFGERVIQAESGERCEAFGEDDTRRYDVALKAHRGYYSKTMDEIVEFVRLLAESQTDMLF